MSLGEKLQKLRKAQHLSQEELAARLSVTRQTISKWELDQSTPELGLLAQISELFGVTTDYLIKETAGGDGAAEDRGAQRAKRSAAQLALCIVLLSIGGVGLIAFCALSALHPWCYISSGGYEYEGLIGYLLGTQSMAVFCLCVLAALLGLGGLAYLSVQEWKARQEAEGRLSAEGKR